MKAPLFLAALVLALPADAAALSLAWQNGSKDIQLTAAAACTLEVVTAAGEIVLPASWRMVFACDDGQGNGLVISGMTVAADPSGAAFAGEGAAISNADSIAHVTYENFSSAPGVPSATSAYYVARLPAAARAKIVLIAPVGAGQNEAAVDSVTVNLGIGLPPVPIMTSAQCAWFGNRLALAATGIGLNNVSSAYLSSSGRDSTPVQILGSALGQVALMSAPIAPGQALQSAALTLESSGGVRAAAQVPASMSPAAAANSSHIVIRFFPYRASQTQLVDETLSSFSFSSPSAQDYLASAGVSGLIRLIPEFEHADTNSVNELGEPVHLEDLADIYRVELLPGADAAAAESLLKLDPDLMYVSKDLSLSSPSYSPAPNDTLFPVQWGLQNLGSVYCGGEFVGAPGLDINALGAWDLTTGPSEIKVGIIDTGVDILHPDLAGHAEYGVCVADACKDTADASDYGNHGTGIASIIGAATNNVAGTAGVAWNSRLISIRAVDDQAEVSPSSVARAYAWADAAGIGVTNNAIASAMHQTPPYDPDIQVLYDATLNSFNRGHLLVAAMGNENDNLPSYPAALKAQVFGVSAVLPNGRRWDDTQIMTPFVCSIPELYQCGGSVIGPWNDIAAPGGHFIAAASFDNNSNQEGWLVPTPGCQLQPQFPPPTGLGFGGTSAASAFVTGAAVLLKDYCPQLTGEDIAQILQRTAKPLPETDTTLVGRGLVNARAALEFIRRPKLLLHLIADGVGDHSTPFVCVNPNDPSIPLQFYDVHAAYPPCPPPPPDPDFCPHDDSYICYVRRMQTTVTFPIGFAGTPAVWVRSSGSRGAGDPSYDTTWGIVVPHYSLLETLNTGRVVSVSPSQVVLETKVYEVHNAHNGALMFTWPTDFGPLHLAYTAIGPGNSVGVDGKPARHLKVSVMPNPVRGQARILLEIPRRGSLRAEVFDVAGRSVALPFSGVVADGPMMLSLDRNRMAWHGMPAGVYFLSVFFDGEKQVRRFVTLAPAH